MEFFYLFAAGVLIYLFFRRLSLDYKTNKEIKKHQDKLALKRYRLNNLLHSPITLKKELPNNYVVIDVETTGLDPISDDIIEIALVEVKDRIPVRHYSQLVKPRTEISYKIANITGIDNSMVQNCPYIEDIINQVLEFIGEKTLLGYNVDFDLRFLAANSPVSISNRSIDALGYSRRWIKGLPSYKLKDVAQFLNVDNPGHHRALNDCLVTQQCFELLRKRNDPKDNIIYVDD